MRQWLLKRGVLYALTQLPMVSLVVGYFFRWTDYGSATAYTVVLGFIVLPVWILLRRNRSDDPDEPAHHFHRYALYALVPYVIYNVSRIPMHYSLDIVFWDHWYDFGSELNGKPVDQYASLVPGTLLHSLQGYVLALGYYVLFNRNSLLNALAYVFLFLSFVYIWTFPTFVLVDFKPPQKWFFIAFWAHFWMALAAWYVPRLYAGDLFRRLSVVGKTALVGLVLALYAFPVTFVFLRVATWQFPLQRSIDQTLFDSANLGLTGGPVLVGVDPRSSGGPDGIRTGEARYRFTLRFGPRSYKDYIKATKALDAGPIRVTGRLVRDGNVIAWCSRQVQELETPNKITKPALYFPTLRRMEFSDITAECFGPAEAAAQVGNEPVDLQWTAFVKLVGDRESTTRTFGAHERGLSVRKEV